MWSYRLYRYPSPSSSSLVYGQTAGADESKLVDIPHEIIGSVVLRALESGSKLPQLTGSEEVKQALQDFTPAKLHVSTGPSDLVNANLSGGAYVDQFPPELINTDGGRGSTRERSASFGNKAAALRGQKPDKGKAGVGSGGKGEKGRKKSRRGIPSSVLMLEALARRRMDAVRQLHEACPQLLASIPVFDYTKTPTSIRTSAECPPVPFGCNPDDEQFWGAQYCYSESDGRADNRNFQFKFNHCPLHKSSRLLDLAAENRVMLVFVLENHTGINNNEQSSQQNKQVSADTRTNFNTMLKLDNAKRKFPDSLACVTATDAAPDVSKVGTAGNNPEAVDASKDLDATNPVTVCIRKNNPEVLQYLLFKHVWQHFLLDEIYKLPQNSLVPDVDPCELQTCPDCRWFLPCAALMGYPYLLELILCGKFCHMHTATDMFQSFNQQATIEESPEISLDSEKDASSSGVNTPHVPSWPSAGAGMYSSSVLPCPVRSEKQGGEGHVSDGRGGQTGDADGPNGKTKQGQDSQSSKSAELQATGRGEETTRSATTNKDQQALDHAQPNTSKKEDEQHCSTKTQPEQLGQAVQDLHQNSKDGSSGGSQIGTDAKYQNGKEEKAGNVVLVLQSSVSHTQPGSSNSSLVKQADLDTLRVVRNGSALSLPTSSGTTIVSTDAEDSDVGSGVANVLHGDRSEGFVGRLETDYMEVIKENYFMESPTSTTNAATEVPTPTGMTWTDVPGVANIAGVSGEGAARSSNIVTGGTFLDELQGLAREADLSKGSSGSNSAGEGGSGIQSIVKEIQKAAEAHKRIVKEHTISNFTVEEKEGGSSRQDKTDKSSERNAGAEVTGCKTSVGPKDSPVGCSSKRGSARASLSSSIPDPNYMVAVSLPVMDRWISRCMHVRLAPLHLACWRCDAQSIKVLLRHNADVSMSAEALESPEMKAEDNENVFDSRDSVNPSRGGSRRSSEDSLELTLNFLTINLNSSTFDVSASVNSLEELLSKTKPPREEGGGGLTPLALLALGVRSPPDFSLSIGKSLGLVMPTLPELWGGQVDRSCPQAKVILMECLNLLLEAGCHINQASTIFGKTFRPMELFLQPSIDLYYAPLMPRGGRDSAVLRCMDLERVGELVLGACWELLARGARLGHSFLSCMEWNLFRMDYMFLQNETLQWRFLHLAIFLGLFPPLEPAVLFSATTGGGGGGSLNSPMSFPPNNMRSSRSLIPNTSTSQADPGPSTGGVDITNRHLPPYTPYSPPPRPSCVPWAPTASRTSNTSTSSSFGSDDVGQMNAPRGGVGVVGGGGGGQAAGVGVSGGSGGGGGSRVSQPGEGVVMSFYNTTATQVSLHDYDMSSSQSSRSIHESSFNLPGTPQRRSETQTGNRSAPITARVSQHNRRDVSEPQSRARSDMDWGQQRQPATVSKPAIAKATSGCDTRPSGSVLKAQMTLWALEERQRRCLERFVNNVVRLSVPLACLMLLTRFMCHQDLQLLSTITNHVLRTANTDSGVDGALQWLNEALRSSMKVRSLRHNAKLVILLSVRWRTSAVHVLPIPECLKRYLADAHC